MNKNELIILQSLPLEVKLRKTLIRIREWYEYHNGNVYVSFSGGKDSTVLLHLVRSIYPNVKAVFSDTGLEYPEIREFVKSISNVEWVKPQMRFDEVIKKEGYPVISKENALKIRQARRLPKESASYKLRMTGYRTYDGGFTKRGMIPKKWMSLVNAPFEISEKCCDYLKKKPLFDYEKQNDNPYAFVGTMACESSLRERKYMSSGCNTYKEGGKSQPIGFWTENDILEYIDVNDLPISKIYGSIIDVDGKYVTTGEKRTGCMFCLFGVQEESCPNRFQRMKETHPKVYSYAMNELGIKQVLDYINVPC